MRMTRRHFVAGAAAGALVAAGGYELVNRLTTAPSRRRAGALPPEQHLLEGVQMIRDNGVEVLVPPLHHQVVTAEVRATTAADLHKAKAALDEALSDLDRRYEATPAGLGVTVAWGLPYFRRHVRHLAASRLPIDRRASAAKKKVVRTLIDAVRFPSDPPDTILEANDVAVLLRSDHLDHIA